MDSQKEMAAMTENDPAGSLPPEEEPVQSPQEEPDTSRSDDDPGYIVETGEAASEDGSVAPVIGGLPAVEGSAWDIGAPVHDRGAARAGDQASRSDQAGDEDPPSS
jgi:hypothetical protein